MGNIFLASGAAYKLEVRQSLVRIPEVMIRLKELQTIIDSNKSSSEVDVLSLLTASDYFCIDEALRNLMDKTIQLGLIDRHLRRNGGKPNFIISAEGSEKLFLISTQNLKFEDFVAQSDWMKEPAEPVACVQESLVLLKGQATQNYNAYVISEETKELKPQFENSISLESILTKLVEDHSISRLAVIDPVESCESLIRNAGIRERLEVFCSIQSDPYLVWYDKDRAYKAG